MFPYTCYHGGPCAATTISTSNTSKTVTLPQRPICSKSGAAAVSVPNLLSEAGACVLAIDDNPNAVRKGGERARENEFVLRRAVFANNSVFDLQVEDNTLRAVVFRSRSITIAGLICTRLSTRPAFRDERREIAFFEPGVDGVV